jgi:acetolactate synthase I/II/III large subunit
MAVSVSERILQLLEVEGINTIFGIPDPSFVQMFAKAESRGWQVIAPHHEQAGAFMADAYWRLTGKPGVIVGNTGPGVANLAAAAVCAARENTPTIFIAGQRARISEQRVRRGRIQYIRQTPHFAASMKYLGVIEFPEQTDEIIQEAFRRAMSGTPGPVYIEYPMNVTLSELDLPAPLRPESYRLVRQGASAEAVREAVRMIRQCRAPILLVGQGVFAARAHDSVAALARVLACPVIQTSGGSSFLEGLEDRTFAYGFSPAGVEAVVKSDLVIAVGTEIGEPLHYGLRRHWAERNAERKWIYVERDPQAIGVNRPIDVPMVGDLRDVVPQLVAALEEEPRVESPELARLVQIQMEHRAQLIASVPSPSVPVHPARFVLEATRAIPEEAVFVRDGGAISIFTWTYTQVRPRDLIWSQNFGHLGTGLPFAIGAQLAVGNDRRVVLMTGDSSFLFHISELETAVRKKLPVVCIVGCDYAWGLEVGVYKRMLGAESPETEAHWGDVRLDKIAEGFGAHGEYVERADEIGPAITRALASGKPAVVQVPIDGLANATEVPGHEEFKSWYAD